MWIFFALTASIILASRKISEKQLVGNAGNSLWWMIRLGSALSLFFLWMIFSRDTVGITDTTVWSIIAITSLIIYPLYTLGYYYAVKHLPLSYFGMLGIIAPVANTVFSYFILGKIPTLAGYIGIASILIGLSILIWWDFIEKWIYQKREVQGGKDFSKWAYWSVSDWEKTLSNDEVRSFSEIPHKEVSLLAFIVAILVYISMGFTPILDTLAMHHTSPFTYAMINQLSAIIPVFIMSYLLTRETKIGFFQDNFLTIALIGLSQGIGWLGSMYAFSTAPNTGYVVALINTHAIITALYGTIILGEKITKKKLMVFSCMCIALISFLFV